MQVSLLSLNHSCAAGTVTDTKKQTFTIKNKFNTFKKKAYETEITFNSRPAADGSDERVG
jgi:hypothetical protein